MTRRLGWIDDPRLRGRADLETMPVSPRRQRGFRGHADTVDGLRHVYGVQQIPGHARNCLRAEEARGVLAQIEAEDVALAEPAWFGVDVGARDGGDEVGVFASTPAEVIVDGIGLWRRWPNG